MDLDALGSEWREHDRKLETNLRLTRQLLHHRALDRTRSALQRHVIGLGIEAAFAFAAVAWLGGFIYSHLLRPNALLSALGLDVIAIAVLADLVRQMILARQVASGDPVAVTQRRLERLRIMRIRHEQGVLLVSSLAWTPFLIVLFEAAFHVNALRVFDRWWMAGNVLFGLAVPGIAYLVARRLPDRVRRSPALQRLLDDLSGRHLKQARAFLSELHDLESPTLARDC